MVALDEYFQHKDVKTPGRFRRSCGELGQTGESVDRLIADIPSARCRRDDSVFICGSCILKFGLGRLSVFWVWLGSLAATLRGPLSGFFVDWRKIGAPWTCRSCNSMVLQAGCGYNAVHG